MGLPRDDSWKAGDLYEPYVGRWSRRVADRFLAWLGLPAGLDWIDVGCGTGALTEAIVETTAPASVRGFDPSAGFLAYAKARVVHPNIRFDVADARSLPLAGRCADASVAGLVLNFVPDPAAAVVEMSRVTRRDGTVASYVWDYADRMELMRQFWDAAVELDPDAEALDEGRRFPICRPEPLTTLFEGAGLAEVDLTPIDVETRFRDFDEYWSPFLGGQGPAPAYVAALSEERRAELRERLRARLPVRSDGAIHLVARAWAVRGTRRDAD